MSDELDTVEQPSRCRHLQTKGMYINCDLSPEDAIVGDGYVWCGKTAGMFGPDSGMCSVEECTCTERSCYVPD